MWNAELKHCIFQISLKRYAYLDISYKKRSARANESMSSECSSRSARSSADGVNLSSCSTMSMGSCSFESIERIALVYKLEVVLNMCLNN